MINLDKFTTPQKNGIKTEGNVLVSAGAGSGKTQVLTQRVLYFIIEKGYKITDFLILTFTNLAANEMKDRIRKTLAFEGLEDAKMIDSADISTFDSFALNIVKKYHHLIGIDANAKLITGPFLKVKINEYLKEILEDYYLDDRYLEFLDKYTFKDDIDFFNLIISIYENASKELSYEAFFDNFINKYFNDEMVKEIKEYHFKKVEDAKVLITEAKTKIIPAGPKGFTFNGGKVYDADDVFDNAFADFLNSEVNVAPSFFPMNFTCTSAPFKPLKDDIAKAKELISSSLTEEEIEESIDERKRLSTLLLEIIKKLHIKVEEFKHLNNAYEFFDIASYAYKIVANNINVRNELKNKYKMIMIDEFQDTSYMQDALMSLISNNNLYTVGDVKQSIYRFRNSRCDLFIDKYNSYIYQNKGIVIDMNTNFRSREGVLDDINYLFSHIMENTSGINYLAEHQLTFGNTNYTKNPTGDNNFDFILYKTDGPKSEKVETEAMAIAYDIKTKIQDAYQVLDKETNKLRPVRYSDFCIIIDRGTKFKDIYDVFNEQKIPLFIEDDENITDNVIFSLLKNILLLLKSINDNNYDDVSFKHSYASVARSFIFNYNDEKLLDIYNNKSFKDDEIIIKFKKSLELDLPFYERFIHLLNDINIYKSFIYHGDYLKLENYLDEYLNAFKALGDLNYTIDEFIETLDFIRDNKIQYKINVKGINIDSVKLINIHKSKGLEYPICYFPIISTSFKTDYKNKIRFDFKYGLIFENDKSRDARYELARSEEERLDNEEKIRLLYVALTRAREKVIFVLEDERYNSLLKNSIKDIIKSYEDDSIDKCLASYDKGILNKEMLFSLCYLKNQYLNDKLESFNKIKDKPKLDLYLKDNDYNTLDNIINSYKNSEINLDEIKLLFNELGYSFKKIDKKIIESIDEENSIKLIALGLLDENYDLINRILSLVELGYDNNTIINLFKLFNFDFDEEFINYINDKISINDRYNYFMMFNHHINLNKIEYNDVLINNYKLGKIDKNLLNNLLDYTNSNLFKNLVSLLSSLIDYKLDNQVLLDLLNKANIKYNNQFINFTSRLNNQSVNEFTDNFNLFIEADFNLNYDHDLDVAYNKLYIDYQEKHNLKFINDLALLMKKEIKEDVIYNHFYDMIKDYININNSRIYHRGMKYPVEESDKQVSSDIILKELDVNLEEVEYQKASKDLKANTNKELLEFGTKIHYVMETLDFNKPDYTNLSKFYQDIIKRFLNSSLMKDYKSGIIYKEYEFIDEINNKNGIIDLMIVYNDHIDIIDYKTKEIDDDAYNNQLNVYKDYIKEISNKEIRMYLYSLLTGDEREVE